MRVAQERAQRVLVLCGQAIAPEVRAHHLLGALQVGVQPGQQVPGRGGFRHPGRGQCPGLLERLVEGPGQPGPAPVHVAAQHDHVHDREDPGVGVVLLFGGPRIWEQPGHPRVARGERPRGTRTVQRVDAAVGEHPGQRLGPAGIGAISTPGGTPCATLSVRPGWCRPPVRYRTAATGRPCRSARMPRIHTAAVSWYSATPTWRPARSRRASVMPRPAVDVDAVVPERPGREHRDGHERRVAIAIQAEHVRGQRQLGGLELAEPQHPEEGLFDRQGQVGEIDPGRPDVTLGQRQRPVVVPAGQGQRHAQAHPAPWAKSYT